MTTQGQKTPFQGEKKPFLAFCLSKKGLILVRVGLKNRGIRLPVDQIHAFLSPAPS